MSEPFFFSFLFSISRLSCLILPPCHCRLARFSIPFLSEFLIPFRLSSFPPFYLASSLFLLSYNWSGLFLISIPPFFLLLGRVAKFSFPTYEYYIYYLFVASRQRIKYWESILLFSFFPTIPLSHSHHWKRTLPSFGTHAIPSFLLMISLFPRLPWWWRIRSLIIAHTLSWINNAR